MQLAPKQAQLIDWGEKFSFPNKINCLKLEIEEGCTLISGNKCMWVVLVYFSDDEIASTPVAFTYRIYTNSSIQHFIVSLRGYRLLIEMPCF